MDNAALSMCLTDAGNSGSKANLDSNLFSLGGTQVRTYGKAIFR